MKGTKKKLIVETLGKKVEQYDLINSLTKASTGITFGQIARVTLKTYGRISNFQERHRVPSLCNQVIKKKIQGLVDTGIITRNSNDCY